MPVKKKVIVAIVVLAIAGGICAFLMASREQEPPQAAGNAIQRAIDEHDEMSRVAEEVAGFDPDETYAETLIGPDTYADPEGRYFSYWICLRWNSHLMNDESEIGLYSEAFDPATAESSYEVKINDGIGTVYQKDGRAYLIWSVVVDGIERLQLLDCDPIISESDMIKMAESCQK